MAKFTDILFGFENNVSEEEAILLSRINTKFNTKYTSMSDNDDGKFSVPILRLLFRENTEKYIGPLKNRLNVENNELERDLNVSPVDDFMGVSSIEKDVILKVIKPYDSDIKISLARSMLYNMKYQDVNSAVDFDLVLSVLPSDIFKYETRPQYHLIEEIMGFLSENKITEEQTKKLDTIIKVGNASYIGKFVEEMTKVKPSGLANQEVMWYELMRYVSHVDKYGRYNPVAYSEKLGNVLDNLLMNSYKDDAMSAKLLELSQNIDKSEIWKKDRKFITYLLKNKDVELNLYGYLKEVMPDRFAFDTLIEWSLQSDEDKNKVSPLIMYSIFVDVIAMKDDIEQNMQPILEKALNDFKKALGLDVEEGLFKNIMELSFDFKIIEKDDALAKLRRSRAIKPVDFLNPNTKSVLN